MNQVPTTRPPTPSDHYPARDAVSPIDPPDRLAAISRRSMLVGLASVPAVVAVAAPAAGNPAAQRTTDSDAVPTLTRNREQRALSRFRYRNAEGFFLGLDPAVGMRPNDRLYRVGIVFQLAISSHLLDVGFDDDWCRRNVGLDVGKALRLANATGLATTDGDIGRLATALSPYSKWRDPAPADPNAGEVAMAAIAHATTRRLLDHVRQATGHPRRAHRGRRQ